MIRILNGHSLQEAGRFSPETMPLTLCERQSQATVTIGPEVPEIAVGAWLQDMEEPGAGIVWRVKTVEKQPLLGSRTLQMEHLINTLKDEIMFGDVTPKTITGNNSAVNCTAGEAIAYILGRQGIWTLGSIDSAYSGVSNPYSFNGENLFSALESVTASLQDACWEYSFDSYPFTISIRKLTEYVDSEMRASRNIQTLRYTVDRSRMYTRFYPIGKNNLHIDGDYVSRNEQIYGTISKVETDQSKATKAELLRWANERISRHCEPSVTVTIAGLEMSEATGEPLDRFRVNYKCRVPLPDYGTTITEKVTKLQWADKIKEKEKVTVTLANLQEDVASIINGQNARSGRSGRAGAKNAEEDHAWFVDTTDHVAMIAEGIAGEGADQDWSRVAELLVDGNGIHQRVTEAQADIVTAYSLIDQTTTAIRLEIGDVQSQVRSFIEQTPEMIHAEVGSAVSGFAQSVIEQTATYIRTEVRNAASAISQSVIEQTTDYIRTEVSAVASGVAWSVITQTMTNIEQKIARKSKVYIQLTNPNDGVNVLYNGDIWIKAEPLKTWNENSSSTWNSQNAKEWRSKYGDKHYVWRDGVWVPTLDTSTMVENEVTLEQTAEGLAIVGRALDVAGETYNSSLKVTAKKIRADVSTAESKLYSVIEQTATSIRAQVANEVEGLQSSIEITEGHIGTSVSAAKSSLWSTIMQTATGIVTTVMDEVSDNYSTITQTSTSIALAVASGKSAIYSSLILVTSTSIALSVAAGKSAVYQSVIEVTSTKIRLEVDKAKSGLYSSIEVQSDRIDLVVSGAGSGATIKRASIVTAINNGGSSVTISADQVNLQGYVKATDITADFINGKIAGIDSVGVKNLAASGSISIKEGNVYYAIERSIKELQITLSENTYKLQKKLWGDQNWSDVGSFSRATSLSGAWSGEKLTVSATPQGNTFDVGFGSYGDHNVDLEITTNGDATKDAIVANTIDIPIKLSSLNSGQTAPISRYTKTLAASIAGLLQSKTVNPGTTTKSYSGRNFNATVPATTVSKDDAYVGMTQAKVNSTVIQAKVYDGLIVLSNEPEYRTSGGHHYIKQYVRAYWEDENGDAGTTIMDKALEFNADLAYADGVANAPDPHPNSMTITRTRAGRTSSGTDLYYGKLYFWDDDDGSYTEAYSGNAYWYRSSVNLGSGGHTVHY